MRCNRILIIISSIFLVSYSAFSQLHADFTTFNSKEGCSPIIITFEDQSTGTIISRQWIYGNGNGTSFGNQTSPNATYINPGYYSVTLIVSDGTDFDTIVKPNFIQVYNDPIADFTITTASLGCNPLTVNFQDLSSSQDGIITFWSWDFYDGNNSSTQSPTHTYTKYGSFPVSLYIVDNHGCYNNKFINNYINISRTPQPNFVVNDSSNCYTPVNVDFTNLSESEGNLTYIWNFGDGNTSNLENPTHVYTDFGIYDITLSTSDENGCSSSLTKNDYISIQEAVADFSTNKVAYCAEEEVVFTNTSIGCKNYIWDFGDGSQTDTAKNPNHYYSAWGNYNVKLISFKENSPCSDTIVKVITVERIEAAFTLDPARYCELPVTVNFTDLSINAISWQWDMGYSSVATPSNPVIITSTLQNPTKTFNRASIYIDSLSYYFSRRVTLIATSLAGCKDTLTVDSALIVTIPNVLISTDTDTKGCIPLNINFSDNSTYNSSFDNLNSRLWEYNDGNTSALQVINQAFTDTGEFQVDLTLTTDMGCIYKKTKIITTGSPQNPDFFINTNTSCASDAVQFYDNSTDMNLIDSWKWTFMSADSIIGDTGRFPLVKFNDTGYFNVTLTVDFNGCKSSIFKQNLIYIYGPYAEFYKTFSCNIPLNYFFHSKIIDADSWVWNFADGSYDSISQNPSHTFASSDYYVSLSLNNNTTGCSFIVDSMVFARNPKAVIVTDTLYGCPGLIVTFNGDSSIDEDIFRYPPLPHIPSYNRKYLWNYGDGSTFYDYGNLEFADSPISHIFTEKGIYHTSLTIEDINKCRVTSYKNITIYNPTPNFSTDFDTGCKPFSVDFNDISPFDTTVSVWNWNFGNGDTSNIQNPTSLYSEYGNYNVSLSTTNVLGCTATISKPGFISVQTSSPSFTAIDSTLCESDSVFFINSTIGNSLNYFWEFGDGNTSTEENPTYFYSDSGSYNVSLKVVDAIGCDTTFIKYDFIKKQKSAVVEFSADTLNADCYPLLVSFNDNSTTYYSSEWNWDFGDQATSLLLNPLHSYSFPGQFDVKLVISSTNFGCKDSIIKSNYVDVKGPYAEISFDHFICKSSEINFTIDSMIDVQALRWDFGDGYYDTNLVSGTSHTYNDFGLLYPQLVIYSDSTNLNYCAVPIRDTIMINFVIANFVISDTVLCIGSNISFLNNSFGEVNYIWDFGDNSQSTNQNPNYAYTSTGNYTVFLTVSDNHSCVDTDSMTITINPIPDYLEISDTIKCDYDTITLDAGSSFDSYLWSDNSTLQTLEVDSQSIIVVSVRNIEGCWSTKDTIMVTDIPTPIVKLGNDTLICEGNSISLFATYSSYFHYLWSTGDTIDTISGFPDSTYIVNVSNICGLSSDTILITKIPLPVVNLGVDTAICIGTSLTLFATGNMYDSYLWNDGTFADSLIADTISTYSVTVSNSCALAIDSISIGIIQYPIVFLGNDTTICSDDSLLLFANSGYDIYSWSNGSTNDSIYISQSDDYYVEVKNACSTASDTMNLIVYDVKIDLGFDTIMCPSETITLDAGQGFETYLWSDNTAGQTLTVNKTGIYYVSVTNMCAFVSDTVEVFYLPDSINLGSDTAICEGNIITFSTKDQFDSYSWHNGFNYPAFTTSKPGTYYLTTENKCGTYSDTISLNIKPLPLVELGADLAVSYVFEIIDAGDDADSYLWSTGETTRTIEVTSGNYTVWVEVDKNGCKASDTIRIINFPYDSGCIFGVPNAFTPNGDNINDVFHVRGYCIEEIDFMIFNRYGEMVFKSVNINLGWDGTYKGKLQESEIYIWYLKVKLLDGQIVEKTGNVALIN